MTKPLTVSMTPAFILEGDSLLRAQLNCLSKQTEKDFSVLIVDHHYSKRKGYMNELSEKYGLDIIHVPYSPATHIAKKLDCSVFNAAYCYSESPRIVRFSCWRFVKPDFTSVCLKSNCNVDFRFHSVNPTTKINPTYGHNELVWEVGSDEVNWKNMPSKSKSPGAAWGSDSDHDDGEKLFRRNSYGNYMVFRNQWIAINGADETFTNLTHYEDIDFCLRARNVEMTETQICHKMYRLHHHYGSHSGRANNVPDGQFKSICPSCAAAWEVPEPNRFDISRRVKAGEIEIIYGMAVWVCRTCFLCGPVYSKDSREHCDHVEFSGQTKANVIPKFKIGRNIEIVTSDMDGKTLAEKVEIYNSSFTDERYFK